MDREVKGDASFTVINVAFFVGSIEGFVAASCGLEKLTPNFVFVWILIKREPS